jgi:hypothetical protein
LSEDRLDQVDRIVFDGEASDRVRVEALGFFTDHTHGFDENILEVDDEVHGLSQDDVINKLSKGNKGKKNKTQNNDRGNALKIQKSVALQLETLTEYVEHQLKEDEYELTELLASAALETPLKGIIHSFYSFYSFLQN